MIQSDPQNVIEKVWNINIESWFVITIANCEQSVMAKWMAMNQINNLTPSFKIKVKFHLKIEHVTWCWKGFIKGPKFYF
jgi:hypothetical protein